MIRSVAPFQVHFDMMGKSGWRMYCEFDSGHGVVTTHG